jgi:hypothetical protein
MEISAIMNIHELAIDRNEKQKADVQEKRRPEESKDNPYGGRNCRTKDKPHEAG